MRSEKNKKGITSLAVWFRWPLIFAGVAILANIIVFAVSEEAGKTLLLFTILLTAGAVFLYFYSRKGMYRGMIGFAGGFGTTQGLILEEMGSPAAICDTNGGILWRNRAFKDMLKEQHASAGNLLAIFPELTREMLAPSDDVLVVHGSFGEKMCRLEITWGPLDSSKEKELPEGDRTAMFVIVTDETELVEVKQNYLDSRACVGLVTIDNYDEALASVDEVRRSMFVTLVDRKLGNYFGSLHGLIKKLEKDKYLFFLMDKDITAAADDRFSVLDGVRSINIGNNLSLTLSIGAGVGYEDYIKSYDTARKAIDMAMGRGGDQAVLMSEDGIQYFGGKSAAAAKNTRVRARVKAQAFRELLERKETVIIVGHKSADVDALGSAAGVWRIAKTMGKKAHIVNGNSDASVKPFKARFSVENGYPEDFFVTAEKALSMMDENTMLVVVDVNRPSYTEEPSLIEKAQSVVVIDHHRMMAEGIDKAELSYIEPFASSASEMVAEIIQYVDDTIRLEPAEADALYGGIVLDTQNFNVQAGVRTFEAAAFLRKKGADVVRVRKMFREDIVDYKAKAQAVDKAQVYRDHFAVSVCDPEGTGSPTVIGAQAANELLEIDGIKAAVVLTPVGDKIFISARSIDEINVQVLMEKLGGGGHKSVAGAQLKDVTVEEAIKKVTDAIDQMIEQGEVE